MKYRGMAVRAHFLIYIAALSVFGAMGLIFSIWALLEELLTGFIISVIGFTGILLLVLGYGKLFVRIVEIHEDKLVFIPFILRGRKKEITLEEIKQIRVTEELFYKFKKGLSLQACRFYDFDRVGDEKIYSIPPFRIESTPEIDLLVKELFEGRVPVVSNNLM